MQFKVVKTNDLSGNQLKWAAAKCQGILAGHEPLGNRTVLQEGLTTSGATTLPCVATSEVMRRYVRLKLGHEVSVPEDFEFDDADFVGVKNE
jgi:hypothetical protein